MIFRFICLFFLPFLCLNAWAQLSGGNGYMIGEHIEIGIDANGMEGTDDLIETNSRGGGCATSYFGFVADANDDDWDEYNGDYFSPGVPENGFGLDINGLEVGNNATSCGSELYQIVGSIVGFSETTDSIQLDWSGTVSGIAVSIQYELQKDLFYYTTKVKLENTSGAALSNVFYYRTMDPDNNQTIGWGYATDNEIISQSGFSNDSAIVRATQSNSWESWVQFEAEGDAWRAYHGGFSNRDGSEMWSGLGFSVIEGSESTADAAIGMSYRIPVFAAGATEEFQFNMRFAEDTVAEEEPDPGIGWNEQMNDPFFQLYPNPTDGLLTIELEGTYDFLISDKAGRILLSGFGEGKRELDLSHFERGMYFLKVRKNGGKFRIKKILLE